MANIALIVGFCFFFQFFLHMFVFIWLPYHGALMNPIMFYETNLFQKHLPIFVIMCQKEKHHVHRLWWKEPRQITY
jgi:hypothetical protein